MRLLLLSLGFGGLLSISAHAEVLAQYDFNNLSGWSSTNVASYCAPCVTPGPLKLNGLSQSLHYSGGPDGSNFRCFAGWDTSYDYSLTRTNLGQAPDTLSFDTVLGGDFCGEITSLSFDWMRPGTSAVTSVQASIFWQDNLGDIQYVTTGPLGPVADSAVGVWNSSELFFTSGSAALPSGIDAAGRTLHVELYAWGGNGGTVYADNVSLNGSCSCAPVPEPGGALLLATSGLVFLVRRRRR